MEKNIQLCGIGNGIVDIQYRITDEELIKIGIPKSEMRLITPEYTKELRFRLKHLPSNRCCGGSTSNTIDAFAKFGGSAALLIVVANDDDGKFYYKELEKNNIKYKNNIIDASITGRCYVLITPDGERTMLTSLAASEHFSIKHLSEELIKKTQWLYAEGYVLSKQNSREALYKAIEISKNNNTKVAISASDVFIIDSYREDIEKILKTTDLFFCNANESIVLTKTKNINAAILEIKKTYPNLNFVITNGSKGASINIDNNYFEVNAIKTNVVDLTGAGDIFAGAFMYGLLNLNDIEKAAKLASYSAAKHISTLGARYQGSFKELLSYVN